MDNVTMTVLLGVLLYVTVFLIIDNIRDGNPRERKQWSWMLAATVAVTVSAIWYIWR